MYIETNAVTIAEALHNREVYQFGPPKTLIINRIELFLKMFQCIFTMP